MLAKILFKPDNPKLKNYLSVLYKTSNIPPEVPSEIDTILRQTELKFYNSIIQHFYKNTDYLKFKPDAKKINARVFFKYLPKPQKQFLHRIYHKFIKLPNFFKKGPVNKVNQLIQRVQFKTAKQCQTVCRSDCYRIEDQVRVELTPEERKQLGADFPCNEQNDKLQLFDMNGNVVPSSDLALYGCGCTCGNNKGGIQINETPVINFNINLENDQEAEDFRKFLQDDKFTEKLNGSNSIDLDKLKTQYAASKLSQVFELQMNHRVISNHNGLDNSELTSYDPKNPYVNQDYLTPKSVGLPDYDDHGQPLKLNKPFVINGNNVDLSDGSLPITNRFDINTDGYIQAIENDPTNLLTKNTYYLKQKNTSPIFMANNHNYPFYYPQNDNLIVELPTQEEIIRSQELQKTLNKEFSIDTANTPFKIFDTPSNLQNLSNIKTAYVRENDKRVI